MKFALFLIALTMMFGCKSDREHHEPFNWINNSDGLQIIGEGRLSRPDADIYNFAFTSSGDTIFFHTTDKGDGESGVAISTRTASGWTKTKPAPFETEDYNEGHVSISPDGKHIIFASDRNENLEGDDPKPDDFFIVSQSSKWTEAKALTSTPKMSEKRGSLANDGTFYYWAYQRGSGMYFFKSQLNENQKLSNKEDAVELLFENYKGENNPYIDPEKRFMLVAVYGKDNRFGKEDIYISMKKDAAWSTPENLGNRINTKYNDTSPYITPDGQYLFFVSDRLTSKSDTVQNRNLYVIRTKKLPSLNSILNSKSQLDSTHK